MERLEDQRQENLDPLHTEIEEELEDGFDFSPQPAVIARDSRSPNGVRAIPSMGSHFSYSGVFDLPDLLDISDIEGASVLNDPFPSGKDRKEQWRQRLAVTNELGKRLEGRWGQVEAKIKGDVRGKVEREVFGGQGLSGALGDRSDVGGMIFPSDIEQETALKTIGGSLSAKQRVDFTMHLFHELGDDPAAVLAQAIAQVSNAVSENLMNELDLRFVFPLFCSRLGRELEVEGGIVYAG